MGFNGISESFFHQDTIRSIILFTMYYVTSFYCNKYLFIPTLHGNLEFHNYSIHTIPNTALLGVFHGEPPGATQFTTNINLWQFSLLNRSINSTLTRLISRPTIMAVSFTLVVSKITTEYIWSHTKEKPYLLRKSFPQKISTIGSFLFFCLMNPRSTPLETYFRIMLTFYQA